MTDVSFLSHERSLPEHGGRANIVQWHVFRRREEAESFVPAIRLGAGQSLVGGYSRDSVGPFWWVGVEVEDLPHWGNASAINKHAG